MRTLDFDALTLRVGAEWERGQQDVARQRAQDGDDGG